MRRESTPIDKMLTIGLMAKYWETGKVKTRLGASIGMTRSARIHRLFVEYLCAGLNIPGANHTLCLSPIQRRRDLLSMLNSLPTGPEWMVIDQGDGDLGQRMQRWFSSHLTDPRSHAILIGADYPNIQPELIIQADRMLRDFDLVLGPAKDGGYFLIGLGGDWSEKGSRFESLFHDIPWSTSNVLSMTRNRANENGLSVFLIETGEDVDTINELNNLLAELEASDSTLKLDIEQILADPNLADSA